MSLNIHHLDGICPLLPRRLAAPGSGAVKFAAKLP